MAKGTLQIRRQIKSIGNTKKMTKAMELVSASKMRKATAAVLSTRPYATHAEDVLKYLSSKGSGEQLHPLLAVRPVKKVGIIVVSTNKGLCGGFNGALATLVKNKMVEEKNRGAVSCELFTMGKRARDLLARSGAQLTADFIKKDITTSISDVLPLIHAVTKQYIEGTLDRVLLVFTDYISSARQKPTCSTLLPFSIEEDDDTAMPSSTERMKELAQCIYEPSPEQVLQYVIPRLLEARVFQAVLESEASEHSARMFAMHNASEAATDMLSDLRLTYNQIRQAGITQEIAEIASGRAALE